MREVITEVRPADAPPATDTPRILATRGVLPPYRYPQQQLTESFADFVGLDGSRRRLLQRVHGNAGVRTRHLAIPIERYAGLDDFGLANDAFIEAGCRLAADAIGQALATAGVGPEQVDLIVAASSTGLSVPSIDARVAKHLGLRQDVRRLPLVGLGCAAGAAGVARLADLLRGHPGQVGVLLTVELCSLTLQRGDTSTANLIASGLFGDGAAAVVMTAPGEVPAAPVENGRHPVAEPAVPDPILADPAVADPALPDPVLPRVILPEVVASRSRLYPDTERAMGWDVRGSGLQIVLGAEIPDLVRTHLAGDVDAFLADHGLSRSAIDWWVCHPGGPKVLEAVQDSLRLHGGELDVTWESLARIGNISSSSVLHVLAETVDVKQPEPGSYGLMLAMGPGFALELVLLRA